MDYNRHYFLLDKVKDCTGTDILEFGVYSGQSILTLLKRCQELEIKPRKVFGFDSFDGLKLKESDKIVHKDWHDGNFDAKKLFKVQNMQAVLDKLDELFKKQELNVTLVPGEFEDLTSLVIGRYDIQPAFYINIDCDLYSSAKTALNFIFDNQLLAVNGLIRYDDYEGVIDGGEALAHQEIVKERGLRFEYLEHCIFRYEGLDENLSNRN